MNKNISIMIILTTLLAIQPITAQMGAQAPKTADKASTWLSWFKSLRTPNRKDLNKARLYVKSKWRCLRHGKGCSKKERNSLRALATVTGVAVVGLGTAGYQSWKKKLDKQRKKALQKELKALEPVLITAAQQNNDDAIRDLIRRGVNINAQNAQGFTPLMIIAQNASTNPKYYCIKCGRALIDLREECCRGCFSINRCIFNTLEGACIIRFLVANGADHTLRNNAGQTVQDIASDEIKEIIEEALQSPKIKSTGKR